MKKKELAKKRRSVDCLLIPGSFSISVSIFSISTPRPGQAWGLRIEAIRSMALIRIQNGIQSLDLELKIGLSA